MAGRGPLRGNVRPGMHRPVPDTPAAVSAPRREGRPPGLPTRTWTQGDKTVPETSQAPQRLGGSDATLDID
eukprot:8055834-Alexandrium_andersonii.AAC.1